jgi:periplasmic divalent cation tolerance protein
MQSEIIQIVTTTASQADAQALAQAVLEQRVGGCVQISGPIESRYRWNNRLETAAEWTLTIKTLRELYPAVERLLLELHPYDEPEIMATPAVAVSAGYGKWLSEQVREPQKDPRGAKPGGGRKASAS